MEKANAQNHYHHNPKLTPLAKSLRKNMPKAEACLWKYQLRAGQMQGYTFLRQRPVLNYIVDFMYKELMLIIEVDGVTHETEEMGRKDKKRDQELEAIGFKVLRFSNWEVLHQITNVSEIIVKFIDDMRNSGEEDN